MHSHLSPKTYVPPPPPTAHFTHRQFFYLAAGFVGIQVCWAVQVGYVTKSLLVLGLAQQYVSYAWLAGPIAGLVAQPIVGIISDKCTSKLGRRRPFLLAGTLITVVALLAFAYAEQIARAIGVKAGALPIAVVSFWVLDFAINTAQGPLRALLADVVPPAQHTTGNAYFAFASGAGNALGSFLGALPLHSVLTVFPGDLQALYTITAVMLLVCMGITVVLVPERPLISTSSEEYMQLTNEYAYAAVDMSSPAENVTFLSAAKAAPYPFWQAFVVQCFSWFGWFALFVFGTSWVGKEVFGGEFHAAPGTDKRKLYDAGVRMGNLGIALQSVLTIIFAFALPKMLTVMSRKHVYFLASILLATALSSTLLLHDKSQAWLATTLLASTGFTWAVTMTVPWSLMSEAVARSTPERAGIYFTMFNLSQCLPEIVVSVLAAQVERVTNSQAAVLALGGLSVFMAAALILYYKLGHDMPQDEETMSLTSSSSGAEEFAGSVI